MKITIRKPIGYTQIGRKDQQEDAVWPPFDKATTDSRCIVLCDGVGGSVHGEIASQNASRVIGEYLTSIISEKGIVTETDVQTAVILAYEELEKIDTEGSVDGQPSMATTLTCVCIHDEGIIAAHMGDSRIYLVRPGQGLLYQSSDHSLVNALLQAGELTLEEAKNFPRKNVITKAIQPHAKKKFTAEVHQLTDVHSGDYVFMCCDGVLEQLTNERLVEILSMDCSDEKKLTLLESESTDRTKDNYTAYLIPIDKVEGESTISNEDDVVTVMVESEPVKKEAAAPMPIKAVPTTNAKPATKLSERFKIKIDKKKALTYAIGIIAIIALTLIFFFIGRWTGNQSNSPDGDFPTQSEIEASINEADVKNIDESPSEDTIASEVDVTNNIDEADSDIPEIKEEEAEQISSSEDDKEAMASTLPSLLEQIQNSHRK